MRKRSCTFEEYGVGIYSETGKQVTRNDKVDPTRASATRDIADKILSQDSSINSSTCLARSQRSSQESTELAIGGHDSIDHKLTETQQVLDLLDQQIGSLNALQQKTGDINRPRLICAENESFACHVSVDNLLSVASESPSPQARLQVLDYYVKHSINEVGTGDCGCRYDYASGGNVLTKLDECVGSRLQSSAESAPPTSSSQSKQQPGNKQRFSSLTFRSPQSSRTSPVERSSWHDSVQSALGSICSLESDPQGNNNDHRFVNHNQHLFIDETYGRNRSATAVTDRQSSVKANTAATISYPAESRRFQGLSGLTSGSHHSRFNSARSSLPETYNELCHQQTTSEVFGQTWSSLPPHQHCSNGLDSFIDVIRSSESETFEEEEVLSDTSNALESLVDSFDALSRRSPSPFCNQSDPFTDRSNGRPTADYLKQDIPTESAFRQHHRYNCLCIESVQAKQRLNNNNNNHPPLPCCQDLLQTSQKLNRLTRSSESCDHNQGDASNCSSTNCRRFHYSAANIQHQQHLHLSSDSTIAVSSPSSSSISEENQVRKRRKLDPTEKSTTLLAAVACCSKASPLNSSSCGYHSSERLAVHKMGSENSDIININRSKRRDFFTTSSTKIEEKDSRLKHNNTQAVGSAKSLGRDLANVGLRRSNSSNCSSSAYALSSPVDGFLAREKEEEVDSMKAVRDIAKMSAPSLSSLQYLPSQVDTFAPSLKQIKSSKKTKKKMSESENEDPNKGNLNPVNVITESRENLKHSESCLLDRLCLCNCMARSHHDIPSKLSLASQQETGVPSSTEATLANKQQAGSGSPLKLNRDSKRAKSYSSDTSTTDDGIGVQQLQRALSPQQSRRVAAKISRENEKQSPSFLNILKSPSAHISRYSRELRRSQQRLEVCREDSSLGSSEELAASEAASSSRNSELLTTTTTGNESGSSFAFNLRARSSSFATSGNRASSFLSSGSGSIGGISKKDEDACLHSSETVARPQSAEPQLHKGTAVKAAASTRGRLDKQSQKVSTYKKFLSPSKLFATGGNKSTNQGNLRPPSDISGGEVDVDDQRAQLSAKQAAQSSQDSPNQSSSFFVRSLHRLSGRKSPAFSGGGNSSSKRKRHDHEDNKSAEHEKGIHQSHSACVSPTISISTASQQVDSLADSINSLDEEVDLRRLTDFPVGGTPSVLDKSRLFLAPEVRLRRVERNGGDSDADRRSNLSASSAYEMTRTHSNHRCRTTNQHDNIYQDTYSPVRYGSEFSDYTSDASVDRAYSVPASPSARRRTSGRSRTQRLAQSPVPFRSPATQSTKIEDGLKVCSTEHFEKHIGNIKDNQEEAQKNLFRTWINHFCPNLIHRDLVEELRDGIKLIGLLAYLTRDKQLFSQYDKLARDKRSYINRIVNTPSSKLRHLSNVSTAIDYLRKNRGMKLINLNPMDIVSGKPNVILGLCWNIILNFQLEQNYLNSQSIDNSSNGSQLDDRTSRFSSSDYAIDEKPKHYGSSSKYGKIGAGISPAEEYSCSDLVVARKKLLDFINKRFDLKLTNLTSNLLDGDVMLVIIKNLLPQPAEMPVEFEQEEKWKASSNDEKLDYCFDLAQNSLNVPRLFSASDLRQQTISDNNSKPLLVYLTMLLSKDPKNSTREATTDVLSSDNESIKQDQQVQQQQQQQQQEDHQEQQQHQDQQPLQGEQSVDEVAAVETKFNDHLVELEKDDRFAVDRLQSTLAKIRELDNLIESRFDGQLTGELDSTMVNRFETLKNRANQIEALIGWINQADALFETTQKSACDLTNSIQEYREFFSPGKVPAISTQLCPTLERQYRECLGTARQRVLVMEQTLKNWYDYEKARQELRDWLSTAEIKLTEALQPIESSDSESQQVEQHTDRLKEVIDYFDLETIDVILNDQAPVNLDLSDRNRLRMSYESLSSRKLCLDDSNSISGSVLSLGSTSSRISTLQSSSKAAHNRLLDNFELKCRLLATMLDAEQKEALLLGVKELKARLKYITEHRVPQVVGELRFHINRLEPEVQVVESSAKQSSEESFAVEKAVDEPKVISKLNQNKSKKIITPPVDSKAKKETHKQHSRSQKQSQKQSRKAINNSKQPKAKKTAPKNIDETSDDDISITRKVWHKIVRAYRASFSLNIVLLICLAGICVVPLIHREACCELVTNHIYYEDSSVNTKPT